MSSPLKARHVLLFPGSTSYLSAKHLPALINLQREAGQRGFLSIPLLYPGQTPNLSDNLTFETATICAVQALQAYAPTRVLARSFGCQVALAALSRVQLPSHFQGLVLWGPCTSRGYRQQWPDANARDKAVRRSVAGGTRLSKEIFSGRPTVEELLRSAPDFSLRLCWGTADSKNATSEEIEGLAQIRRASHQPVECVLIDGIGHSVTADADDASVHEYYDAMFR